MKNPHSICSSTVNTPSESGLEDVWKLCDLSWSPQCKVVVLSALVDLFYVIWNARNQARFNSKTINWKSSISMIISSTALSTDYQRGDVAPSSPFLIKCNIDGAAKGNPGLSAAGGVFRDREGQFILCFSEPLGISTSYISEMHGAFRAIEIAFQRGWRNLWIETDSPLVVLAFQRDGKT
ncbi:uncharacterized protein [Medicago truncatula]|uniref:uncharacterized protein n=1 Tax=Medicago truncatula TaxID=3880 RepID=UPI000D2F289D|nr:uncharacterized protein LOC112422037 [Medicago truncatula]